MARKKLPTNVLRTQKTKGGSAQALTPEVLPAESKPAKRVNPSAVLEREDPENEVDAEVEDQDEGSEPTEAELEEAESEGTLPATRNVDAVDIDPELKAISPTDPLRQYLEEIRKHPLLDPEEEFQLAVRMQEKGDLQAAKRLVTANLRLVVKIAFEYRNFYSNVLDLIQEGNIGLMKAVSKYDPKKGARLGYYSSWWIRSYMLKYMLDNFRLVRLGTTQAQKKLFYHLLREKERLEAQGVVAAPKLLAERLDVREKDVIEMSQRLSSTGAEMSLDAPVDSEGGPTTRLDFLQDEREGVDDELARDQLLTLLKDRLPEFEKTLNPKETSVLQARILAEDPKTLQEVADLYGLTRERARQIENKVIEKLRKFLADDLE